MFPTLMNPTCRSMLHLGILEGLPVSICRTNSNPPENINQRRPNRDSEDCIREFRRSIETLNAPGLVVEVRMIGIPGRDEPHPAVRYFDEFDKTLVFAKSCGITQPTP